MRLNSRPPLPGVLSLVLLLLATLGAAERAARGPRPAALSPLASLLLLSSPAHALSTSSSSGASSGMSFCRCTCFGRKENATIIPLYRPVNPATPCLTCTRQFCLDQKLAACVGAQAPDEDPDTATGEGGDVEARCFQRDSPKSHFIVVLFLTITATLLVVAALKHSGVDLAALFARAGVRGIISELVQGARAFVSRRRGGSSYSSVSF